MFLISVIIYVTESRQMPDLVPKARLLIMYRILIVKVDNYLLLKLYKTDANTKLRVAILPFQLNSKPNRSNNIDKSIQIKGMKLNIFAKYFLMVIQV